EAHKFPPSGARRPRPIAARRAPGASMPKTRRLRALALSSFTAALVAFASLSAYATARPAYPETKRVDTVDDWHGTKVPDPYRWLEQDPRTSQEVSQWIAAENKVTQAYLEQIPDRELIHERLKTLGNYERWPPPVKAGGRFYFAHNTGLQNQPVLFAFDSAEAAPRQILDPNTWSADGTVALSGTAASDDGR